MKTITIRELHQQTGRWVRQASSGEVHVTGRGKPIAGDRARRATAFEARFRLAPLHAGISSSPKVASRWNRCDGHHLSGSR